MEFLSHPDPPVNTFVLSNYYSTDFISQSVAWFDFTGSALSLTFIVRSPNRLVLGLFLNQLLTSVLHITWFIPQSVLTSILHITWFIPQSVLTSILHITWFISQKVLTSILHFYWVYSSISTHQYFTSHLVYSSISTHQYFTCCLVYSSINTHQYFTHHLVYSSISSYMSPGFIPQSVLTNILHVNWFDSA